MTTYKQVLAVITSVCSQHSSTVTEQGQTLAGNSLLLKL